MAAALNAQQLGPPVPAQVMHLRGFNRDARDAVDPDRISVGSPSPPRAPSRAEADRRSRLGRLHAVWHDLLFSDKSAAAMTSLYSYGYFVSIMMTLWGWHQFTEFGKFFLTLMSHLYRFQNVLMNLIQPLGRQVTIFTKLMIQFIGLQVSLLGVYACYMNEPKKLSFFFINQLLHTILTFLGLYYLFRTSREELFEEYVTEPFYNMKLVDYPFGPGKNVIDMSAEPAYEVSLIYFRSTYMLIVTSVFNIYTLFSVGRILWNQEQRTNEMRVHLRRDGEERAEIEARQQNDAPQNDAPPEEPSFLAKVGLLFGA